MKKYFINTTVPTHNCFCQKSRKTKNEKYKKKFAKRIEKQNEKFVDRIIRKLYSVPMLNKINKIKARQVCN